MIEATKLDIPTWVRRRWCDPCYVMSVFDILAEYMMRLGSGEIFWR